MTQEAKNLCAYVAKYLLEELDAVYMDPEDRPDPNNEFHVMELVKDAMDAYAGGAR